MGNELTRTFDADTLAAGHAKRILHEINLSARSKVTVPTGHRGEYTITFETPKDAAAFMRELQNRGIGLEEKEAPRKPPSSASPRGGSSGNFTEAASDGIIAAVVDALFDWW
jgi:hypothetical protein